MAKLDAIGAWSEEKLDLLRRYLAAYTSIMTLVRTKKNWPQEFAYIDAFAGSVTPEVKRYSKRDESQSILPGLDDDNHSAAIEYVDGSPLVALKTDPPFDIYYFNDKNQARIRDKIVPLVGNFPNRRIEIRHGDCNDFLLNDIVPLFAMRSNKRAFIFIDPYGLQVRWETIKALGVTGTFDVFINFPIQGITRQLGDKPPSEEIRRLIDSVMGDTSWYNAVYTASVLPLFGEPTLERKRGVAEDLALMYTKNLKLYFKHVSPPRIMTQQTKSPLYALILASQAELAVKKMNTIFTSFDKLKAKERKRS